MSGKASKVAIRQDREIPALVVDEGKAVKRVSVHSRHGGGLHIEIRADSRKRFVYRARVGGKQIDFQIGYYPATSLKKAREKHEQAVAWVKQGIDPRTVMREAKEKNISMPSLSELFADWMAMKVKTKTNKGTPISARTLHDYQRVFDCHLGKQLGKVRVCDLSRPVIFSFLEGIIAQEATRKSLVLLNQILDRAVDQGHIELNPARTIKPAKVGGSMGAPRDRHLLVDELRMLWRTLGDAEASATSLAVADCLRLIMLTGVRRSEAAGMRFDQIDGDRWTIPVTKNGRAHVVTLHPLALEILERQRGLSAGPWVFASTSNPMMAVTADAVTKALDRIRVKRLAELEPFHVHDLRRSVATGCGEYLDAPERLIEKLLNHQVQDRLVRTYQAGEQAEKLRQLWLSWGNWIAANVAKDPESVPDNVVPIAASK
ncbi:MULTISPECIES: tyrosine-type recombinase/integrase [Aeromonas]|uniref:tyrosine-type recombinase/integrase n=1 Tax=Aeromonas sp. QDB17 TaxID=2990485 RepID=UPI0022E641E4|nr:site-specific integrase [Aeromonas sp. QDB17]